MKLGEILSNLDSRMGIKELNAMQRKMIDARQSNVVLLAPTGSGKTVAFCTAMLMSMKNGQTAPSAVILAPSRELVLQTYRVVKEISTGMKAVALYGGHSMIDEKNSLQPVPDIIVATPGRLTDHIKQKNIDLYTTRILVLDEYDKSLELGFADQMKKIVRTMPNLKRTFLISATRLADMPEFMSKHEGVEIDCLEVGKIQQKLQVVEVDSPQSDKLQTLADLLRSVDNQRIIVFVNHRDSAERVFRYLSEQKLPVALYHGGLEQQLREKAIDLLNNGTTPILISTDLGARGLDIDSVGSVVHYHIPLSQETWTHRNGRTARQDAHGTIYVIMSDSDSQPDYIRFDRKYSPSGTSANPISSQISTIYFNAGKKEKLSRGDIVGFLIKQGGLNSDEIGRIVVRDHNSIVAVPKDKASSLIQKLSSEKIKGKRVRITDYC
ncbi:DEAD/DEAH box helicase [Muribaculum caecicola]|uniref:DEAD/DEAH box helicase n=2 Tax=Muribaculum TaxID=1918540 RepID=A0AC61S3S4_9BACT|nr:DEAD/DEAH box helicase [Muribaculum caecicola]THG45593.1 DEAD/DEAH box helicase [Muribaculum caecicola]